MTPHRVVSHHQHNASLDFGAVVALIGWLIIELVVIAPVRLFRPAAVA